ncbi:MAG: hypothetical protein OZSIB_4268 [Candidatus Ozemobacter sibiricus]|uniref:Uncharacterized protein n=1 Tax=Candidatus Ozemobacter sibiricus TaxID=2268124 RepID=A0A367ZN06_9BACT|nr:MAG: hypothetical protein OZSIB_4268 [Candidatus Ozemobacter sibiricus]
MVAAAAHRAWFGDEGAQVQAGGGAAGPVAKGLSRQSDRPQRAPGGRRKTDHEPCRNDARCPGERAATHPVAQGQGPGGRVRQGPPRGKGRPARKGWRRAHLSREPSMGACHGGHGGRWPGPGLGFLPSGGALHRPDRRRGAAGQGFPRREPAGGRRRQGSFGQVVGPAGAKRSRRPGISRSVLPSGAGRGRSARPQEGAVGAPCQILGQPWLRTGRPFAFRPERRLDQGRRAVARTKLACRHLQDFDGLAADPGLGWERPPRPGPASSVVGSAVPARPEGRVAEARASQSRQRSRNRQAGQVGLGQDGGASTGERSRPGPTASPFFAWRQQTLQGKGPLAGDSPSLAPRGQDLQGIVARASPQIETFHRGAGGEPREVRGRSQRPWEIGQTGGCPPRFAVDKDQRAGQEVWTGGGRVPPAAAGPAGRHPVQATAVLNEAMGLAGARPHRYERATRQQGAGGGAGAPLQNRRFPAVHPAGMVEDRPLVAGRTEPDHGF